MIRIPIWLIVSLLCVWIALAEEVTGPTVVGGNVTRPPVTVGGVAFPSPDASPVTKGKADRIATDGQGAVWVKILGSLTSSISNLLTADSDTSANTTPGAGVMLLAPAAGGAVAVNGTEAGINAQGADAADAVLTSRPLGVGGVASTISGLTAATLGRRQNLAVSTAGFLWSVATGAAANGATAAGNPVQVGGVYRATPSTLTDGQAGSNLLTSNGAVVTELYSGTTALATTSGLLCRSVGLAGHDAAITGAPVRIAGRARGAVISAVAVDDVCDLVTTVTGLLRTVCDASSVTTGVDSYCNPAHAGGSSEVTVKASSGNVYDLHVANPNTTDVYLLLFDASNPTPGTTSPTRSFCVPGGTGSSNCGVYDLTLNPPILFGTAITATVVTAANGSSAPASAVDLNIGYK